MKLVPLNRSLANSAPKLSLDFAVGAAVQYNFCMLESLSCCLKKFRQPRKIRSSLARSKMVDVRYQIMPIATCLFNCLTRPELLLSRSQRRAVPCRPAFFYLSMRLLGKRLGPLPPMSSDPFVHHRHFSEDFSFLLYGEHKITQSSGASEPIVRFDVKTGVI